GRLAARRSEGGGGGRGQRRSGAGATNWVVWGPGSARQVPRVLPLLGHRRWRGPRPRTGRGTGTRDDGDTVAATAARAGGATGPRRTSPANDPLRPFAKLKLRPRPTDVNGIVGGKKAAGRAALPPAGSGTGRARAGRYDHRGS